MSARGGDPTRCVPESDRPTIRRGETVSLVPDEDESWLETYPALDLDGRVIEGVEDAYYSWFATAGRFSSEVTRAPSRAPEWTAPDDAAEVRMWVVVRDGHFGASACEFRVDVVP